MAAYHPQAPTLDRHTPEITTTDDPQLPNTSQLMRKYGLEAGFNIQVNKEAHILDFGHYVVDEEKTKPNPLLAIPDHLWGYNHQIPNTSNSTWHYSKYDRSWIWAHELAEALYHGRAQRTHVEQHFHNLLDPVLKKWAQNDTCQTHLSR